MKMAERGFMRTVGSVLLAPFERAALDVEESRAQRAITSHLRTQLEEAGNQPRLIQPEDDIPFAWDYTEDLDEGQHKSLRDRARYAGRFSTHIVGYRRTMVRFVMGKGPEITFEFGEGDEAEAKSKLAAEWWAEVWKANNGDELEDEIMADLLEDGEIFVRLFDHDIEGPMVEWQPDMDAVRKLEQSARITVDVAGMEPETYPAGMTFMRLVPPEEVADPDGHISHGVLTAANDVCTVLGYCITPNGAQHVQEIVPADQMIHVKIGSRMNYKRGRSAYEPLLKRDKQYEDWLGYRITLNLVRSAVAFIKRVRGGTNQVNAVRDAQQATRLDNRNDSRLKMLRGGTTIHTTGDPENDYAFKSPQLQAQDAQHDGRAILLTMSAASGMPEYIYTGDASNSNYASTMVAESPAVREWQSWQDLLEPLWVKLATRALERGVEHGAVDLEESDLAVMDVVVTQSPLLHRDEEAETRSNEIKHKNGILSREGWAERAGIDWDVERPRVEAERQADVEFAVATGLGMDGQQDDGGDEDGDE